jgi:heme exporter protein B
MSALRALVWRDVVLSVRAGGGAGFSAGVFAVILVLAPLGVRPDPEFLKDLAPGYVWIAALLATLIGLERVIQPDVEDGTLDLLRLSSLPLELVVLARILTHWLTSGLVITLLSPLAVALMSLEERTLGVLLLALALGSPGLSAIGVAAASIGAGIRRGGSLLALIVLPLYLPTLIFGASAVAAAENRVDPSQALLLLAASTLIAGVVGAFAGAAALRLDED